MLLTSVISKQKIPIIMKKMFSRAKDWLRSLDDGSKLPSWTPPDQTSGQIFFVTVVLLAIVLSKHVTG